MDALDRTLTLVFGDEGDVLADSATAALVIASGILVTGTFLVSPIVADMASIFEVSEAYAGWLVVAYTASATLVLPFVGVVTDRIGRKSTIVVGLLLFGFGGAAVGLTSQFEVVLALRIVQGVGYAFGMPTILVLFGDLYSGSQEATLQGIRVTSNSTMNATMPVLSGALFVYSWRYSFALFLWAIPVAVWVWYAVPPVEAGNSEGFGTYLRGIIGTVRDATMSLLFLSFVLRFVVVYGMLTYISVLAVEVAGLAVVAVGALLSLRSVTQTLSSTQTGRLALSFDPALLTLASFVVVAIGVAIMGAIPRLEALVLGAVVSGVGDGILSPSQKSLVNRMSPPENRDRSMSIAMTCQNVGKVIGPASVGALLGIVGPAASFVLLGGVCGAAGGLALLVVHSRYDQYATSL